MNECSGGTKDNCWRGQTTSVSGLGGKHLMVIARPVGGVGSNANGCLVLLPTSHSASLLRVVGIETLIGSG